MILCMYVYTHVHVRVFAYAHAHRHRESSKETSVGEILQISHSVVAPKQYAILRNFFSLLRFPRREISALLGS